MTSDHIEGPVVDTVGRAEATPDEKQPYVDLGLNDEEYNKIRDILGRRPTTAELSMYSIMWSEHCSYKSSRVHLRQFGEKNPKTDRLLAGIGANAGVIQITEDTAVTFKVESHNHPSYIEPMQGAATGVGGIIRDILAMGARPVAVMDSLRFGDADHPDTARVLPGVVSGISHYGNCVGLPNIGGETIFDPCYQGNPLVNALSVGVMPVERLQSHEAAGIGNVVVLLGAKTGRDGIGGVSVLASATFDADDDTDARPTVQVGDPFTEKLLIECCLELYDAGLVTGIQDLGGAGLTCALSETAAAGGGGMHVDLERVPLRAAAMEPHEILASESQERMLLIVDPAHLDAVLSRARRWGLLATALGEVTDSGRLIIDYHGHTVVDCPPVSLADDGPVYERPIKEPNDRALLAADRAETLSRPSTPEQLRATVLKLASSPNLASKDWVTEQYDNSVLGNTVLSYPQDSGMIRLNEDTGTGIAISLDGNGRFARLDPYQGAQLALAEAYRNVAVTGAVPQAVTNCLNFGSPEDPNVMWQFQQAVTGLADGCAELGIPVTGGNVSFYNQTGVEAIHPTPVVGVLGVIDNVEHRIPLGLGNPGDTIAVIGYTEVELSGSEWAWVEHRHLGGTPPKVNLDVERRLATVMLRANRSEHFTSAHDLSDGGLSQALVEAVMSSPHGARIGFAEEVNLFGALFSESAGRVLVTIPRGQELAVEGLCKQYELPFTPIGMVDETVEGLRVENYFTISRQELAEAAGKTLGDIADGLTAAEGKARRAAEAAAPLAEATEASSVDAESAAEEDAGESSSQ
ncbi:phosphoribosylformylglycinamidine synthase subunit PurL [Natronoglycomyces albus]|uniref:Phosphoribosylformylglycinamidine synthase subunit PurL n=1 Tax=Natronoglycomyces albus TaxID=2811108 RepID=A0A895XPL8_9ACTN|nr:phosphoribosylformylglycinamidine synthase subunit PurL [Natronoglycomyces albus]QSB05319.1 phosphoribosylformylglycinamidine synthase subunit PurL [Natronoglycomyces albus]